VEGLQWWERRGSSSMAWSRERVKFEGMGRERVRRRVLR